MNDLEPAANYDAIIRQAKALRAEAVADLLQRIFSRRKAALPAQG